MPLPTKLNELCNHNSLMDDVWISPSIGQIPCWMEDKHVHNGIRTILKRDCCTEKEWRFSLKVDNLCRWYRDELADIELALRTARNENFGLLLQHCREQLWTLIPWWELATWLSQGTSEIHIFQVQLTIIEALEATFKEHGIDQVNPDLDLTLDAEDEVTLDYLIDKTLTADEEKPSHPDPIPIKILWQMPPDLTYDPVRVMTQVATNAIHDRTSKVILPEMGSFARFAIEPADLAMLDSPTSWINDICINSCISLLFSAIHGTCSPTSSRFTVFSTHEQPWWNDVPVSPSSLSPRPSSQPDRRSCNSSLNFLQLSTISPVPQADLQSWTAHPLITDPVQTNDHNCGIWVLAIIAATFQAFGMMMSMTESDMASFHRYLHGCILAKNYA
ncbi:hypothetical protein JVT61DRAFT_11460 [Boletus reticuloceps]|uniref:Ubiquitin-like protease family profile domain-containing protein n=1 Tax=Boletus reticuloceps TaxID=495285 RepID=A0A8I2YWM2_9AGAM|nr:hypothetical protein JVT61DRAFT_11460 [Boletus reticuloceps]